MKLHLSLVGATVMGLSVTLPAQAASLAFEQVSPPSTVSDFGGLPVYSRYGNASINDKGTVTYEAFQGSCVTFSGNCVVVGFNTPPYAIVSTNPDGSTSYIADINRISGSNGFDVNGYYNSIVAFSASTNNVGTTVLAASGYNAQNPYLGGPTAVLTGSGGPLTTIANSTTPFGVVPINPTLPFSNDNVAGAGQFASAPAINDKGTVAYVAGDYVGPQNVIGLFTKSSDGKTTKIADDTGELKDFWVGLNVGRGQGPFAIYSLPSINNDGTVAFGGDLKAGGSGIFTGNGDGKLTTIADTSQGFTYFSSASINNLGDVAFDAGLPDGGSAIVKYTGGKLTTLASTTGSSLFTKFLSDVALNDNGDVAFLAELNNGGKAIFTEGSDLVPHQLISTGEFLDGLQIADLFVSHEGLNNGDQVAFDALLANGAQSVFVAKSVPEPGSEAGLLGLGLLGAIALKRQSSHRKIG
jgi:hypothetical protein